MVDEGLGGIVEVGPTLDGELDGVLGAALRVLRVVELGVRQGGQPEPSSSKKPAATTRTRGGRDGGGNRERRGRARGGGARAARRGRRSAPKQAQRGDAHVDARGFIRSEASGEPGIQDARAGGRRAGADRWSAGGGGMSRGRGRPDVSRGEAARANGSVDGARA